MKVTIEEGDAWEIDESSSIEDEKTNEGTGSSLAASADGEYSATDILAMVP